MTYPLDVEHHAPDNLAGAVVATEHNPLSLFYMLDFLGSSEAENLWCYITQQNSIDESVSPEEFDPVSLGAALANNYELIVRTMLGEDNYSKYKLEKVVPRIQQVLQQKVTHKEVALVAGRDTALRVNQSDLLALTDEELKANDRVIKEVRQKILDALRDN